MSPPRTSATISSSGLRSSKRGCSRISRMGITNPTFNPVCLGPGGGAAGVARSDQSQPSAARSIPLTSRNPDLLPGLVPYDLTRGGSYFLFHGIGNINQFAFYATDDIKLGQFQRERRPSRRSVQRPGIEERHRSRGSGSPTWSNRTGTVLRAAYSRTFETPFNENLLLSSATGSGGLAQNIFGAKGSVPIEPGSRNQFNGGFQQKIGHWLVFDGDYFWKFTHNAYDFDVLFNTPITFPIAWHNSKLDGVTGRVSTDQPPRLPGVHDLRAHARPLLPARSRRPDLPGNRVGSGRVPHRSRPGVPADHQPPLSARQGWTVGRRSSGVTTAAWW